MQTSMHSGDASRDIAAALLDALDLDAGAALAVSGLPEPGERLQDILDPAAAPQLDVRETFDFWLDDETADNPEVLRSLEDAKAEIAPTAPVPGVEHAYWCRMNGKEFVRWVRGEDEDAATATTAPPCAPWPGDKGTAGGSPAERSGWPIRRGWRNSTDETGVS